MRYDEDGRLNRLPVDHGRCLGEGRAMEGRWMGIEWVPLRRAGSTCALSRWPSSGREAKVRDLAGLPEGCSASNKAVAQLPSGLIHASRGRWCQSCPVERGTPPGCCNAPLVAGRLCGQWANARAGQGSHASCERHGDTPQPAHQGEPDEGPCEPQTSALQ